MNGSTSVRFTEEMKGHISFGDKDYERGAREGRNDSTTLMFRLTVEDLDLFCEVIGRLLIQEKGPDRTSGEPDLWFDLGVSMGIERPHSKLSSPQFPLQQTTVIQIRLITCLLCCRRQRRRSGAMPGSRPYSLQSRQSHLGFTQGFKRIWRQPHMADFPGRGFGHPPVSPALRSPLAARCAQRQLEEDRRLRDRQRPKLSRRCHYLCKLGGYTTRLSAMIKSKETTDAIAVTRVSALNVP
jgi:hypothetical protein